MIMIMVLCIMVGSWWLVAREREQYIVLQYIAIGIAIVYYNNDLANRNCNSIVLMGGDVARYLLVHIATTTTLIQDTMNTRVM